MVEYVRLFGEPLGVGTGASIVEPGVIAMPSAMLTLTITKTAKQAAKNASFVCEAIIYIYYLNLIDDAHRCWFAGNCGL